MPTQPASFTVSGAFRRSFAVSHWKVLAALGATLLALGGVAQAATIDACSAIGSNTTWTADNVYRIANCSPAIAAGATLTIQPGTVVKFSGTASALIVNGSLQAVGNASQKVVFTSLADDSRGGDTNGDGSATAAAAGDWYGLLFRPGSTGRIEHFFLGHAGSGVFNSPASLWNRAQIDVDQAAIELRDGEIALGKRKGVHLNGDGITPVLQRLTIRDNVREAGNTSTGAIGYPVYQTSPRMQPSYADLTLLNNERDVVMIYDFRTLLTQDLTLGGAPFGVDCGYTLCQLFVPSGITLTLQPGTVIDFSDPFSGSAPFSITVEAGGSLIAEGTSTQPITLHSSRAAAGDGAAHYWYGIWAKAGSSLRLAHCDIGQTSNSNFGKGAVQIDTSDAQLRDCRLHHGSGDGLYVSAPAQGAVALSLLNLEITDNARHGVYLEANLGSQLRLALDGGQVDRNGHAGLSTYTYESSVIFALSNLSVSDNGQLGTPGTPAQTAGIHSNQYNVSPALDNVTLAGNVGPAVYWYCDGSIAATGLTVTGNQHDTVRMPSCDVYGGREWDVGGAGGIALEAESWVKVKANAFLSIQPGSELRFPASSSLSVTGGTLFALGTAAAPIRFLGQNPVPAGWYGIQNSTDGAVFLSHCEIAHGGWAGSNGYAGLFLSYYAKTAVVQNCDIHDNARGIVSALAGAVIRNNTIRDNSEFGVSYGGYSSPPVDARDNWWGVASGPYHATLNPTGEGDTVSDDVLFDPWLQVPPEDGGLIGDSVIVVTGAPDFVSPGQTVDYAVQYLNLLSEPVQSALVVMQLPVGSEFVSATHDGVYWADRHQVVWRPGTVPAGAVGGMSVTLRFVWGLPASYRDGSLTLLSGDNYRPETHSPEERTAYLALSADALADYASIDDVAYAAERGQVPALELLHQAALQEGFHYYHAAHIESVDGVTATMGIYLHPVSTHARLLLRQETRAAGVDVGQGFVSLFDANGGRRTSFDTGQQDDWGDWVLPSGLKAGGCTYEQCKFNCRAEKASLTYLAWKAGSIAGMTVLGLVSGGTTLVGAAATLGELGLTAIELIWTCDTACYANPNAHCCTDGQFKWAGGYSMSMLTMCFKSKCSALGTWVPDGSRTCVTGTRCVAKVTGASESGCTPCNEQLSLALGADAVDGAADWTPGTKPASEDACLTESRAIGAALPRCKDLELFVAKDPNDITGPDGDVLPGQSLDYVIRFENEGQGRAYGVYVVNALPEDLDESTLVVNDGGWYVPATRQLVWVVGELGPKGDLDSEGSLSYTVNVRAGLPSGTPIANQAVVYFPSVPETTPTNTWVNLVQPLAAIPQTLDTDYETPLPIVIDGREVSGLPLGYAIEQGPLRGTLAGSAPNLTYSPLDGVVGEDSFTFTVSNGTSTSRPAQVLVRISSNGDLDPPVVQSIEPEDGAVAVSVTAVPPFADDDGPGYGPVVALGLSEPLDPATVAANRVLLLGADGPVPASVRFDGTGNRIVLIPRAPLAGETVHTVSLLAGITDLAGNPLAPGSWQFTTGVAPTVQIFGNGFEGFE